MINKLRQRDTFHLFSRFIKPEQISEARNDAGHYSVYALIFVLFGLMISAIPDSLPQQNFAIAGLVTFLTGLAFAALAVWYAHLIRVTQAVIGGETPT